MGADAWKEALRLYPPTWLAVRRVAAACDLGGYPLRPGQAVLFSSYVLHRDPRWHPQADRFVPQRWLDGTTDGLPRCASIPFGAGPRYCPAPSWPWRSSSWPRPRSAAACAFVFPPVLAFGRMPAVRSYPISST
ncbi:MAG: cytochrome P450 [Egibacteraceae bacterium]